MMTKRDYLRKLEKAGLLQPGIQLGIINWTATYHAEIFDYWFSLLDQSSSSSAALDASIKFNVAISTVWNIIKSMRSEATIKEVVAK